MERSIKKENSGSLSLVLNGSTKSLTLQQKKKNEVFTSRISSVRVSCGFGHIYWWDP